VSPAAAHAHAPRGEDLIGQAAVKAVVRQAYLQVGTC
jgi:hypothetical protein